MSCNLKSVFVFFTACIFACVATAQVLYESQLIAPADGEMTTGLGAFGIALNEDVIALTAWESEGKAEGEQAGAIYLFNRQTRDQVGLIRSSYRPEGYFPYAMDIDEDYLIATDRSDNSLHGLIHIYNAVTGELIRTIVPNHATQNTAFGIEVAAANDKIAVTAAADPNEGSSNGAVYIYDIASGEQLHRLQSAEQVFVPHNSFGRDLAMDDEYVYIGSPKNRDQVFNGGAVHIYSLNSGEFVRTIYPEDPQFGAEFGNEISVSENILAVGVRYANGTSNSSGAVYLYDIESGHQLHKIVPCSDHSGHRFGTAVSLSQGRLAVVAPLDVELNPNIGSIFIYDIYSLSLIAQYYHVGVVSGSYLDTTIEMSGDDLVYRLRLTEGPNTSVAGFSNVPCAPDLSPDGSFDHSDILEFINQRPDLNCDGVFDFFDVSDFVSVTENCYGEP
ncbi:MAG: hypothetical protein JJ974_10070 [Phycisphaerales bacterium]|nr:hypothetical protein [Phycisphaerales bacterium]